MKTFHLLFLILLAMALSAAGAVVPKPAWDDSVRICVIWNSGTGTDGMPDTWQQKTSEIGDSTRSFVMNSVLSVSESNKKNGTDNIKQYTGTSPTLDKLRSDFKGKLPHVIAYLNSGYTWNQYKGNVSDTANLYKLLRIASDSGVGIVAIGDDAAYDAKSIFPLTGYKGAGNIIQLHSYDDTLTPEDESGGLDDPYMEDGVNWMVDPDNDEEWIPSHGFSALKIKLNPTENSTLPDSGILRAITINTLTFKPWGEKDGRGQADADVWDIDKSKLDISATVGLQSGKGDYGTVPPAKTPDLYKVISALQDQLNRVVMLCYQPQYIVEKDASLQIVYNSLYWASKAKDMMKISKPEATPSSGSPTTVGKISLTVDYPTDTKAYTIRFQINSGSWENYSSPFDLPINGTAVTVKACAIPTNPAGIYLPSDTATFTYQPDEGPVVESARIIPGVFNLKSSQRAADTLLVTFDKAMKDFDIVSPFLSKDRDNKPYTFTLAEISHSGKNARFTITSIAGQLPRYLPENEKDSLAIDPAANLEDINGNKQTGKKGNKFVPVKVDGIAKPQIATPEADPNSGNTQVVTKVKLSVAHPEKSEYYTLRYAIDGDVSETMGQVYTGEITLPKTGKNVTLRAIAVTRDSNIWRTSEIMTRTYEYVGGPVIETAELRQGSMTDFQTTAFAPDTILIGFNKDVKDVTNSLPFLSNDNNKNEYKFRLKYLETAGRYMRFERLGCVGKPDTYTPESGKDSIKIDILAKITGKDEIVQDDPNNPKVPLTVRSRPIPQIATPTADPSEGTTQSVRSVKISVKNPHEKYYTLRYAINGTVSNSSSEVPANLTVDIPAGAKSDVVLSVIAFSDSAKIWRTSETATFTYKYIAPPIIDSAVYSPGSIKDFATSEMNLDTLRIYYNQDVNAINSNSPYISNDRDKNRYTFILKDMKDSGRVHSYLVESVDGKPKGYLPTHLRDEITIDSKANVTASSSGIVQDGSNNVTVPLIVKPVPSNIKISTIWYDATSMPSLKEKLVGFKGTTGILILVDPQAKLLQSEWDRYSGSVQVFDAIGHRVNSLESLTSSNEAIQSGTVTINDRLQFAILWNGKNVNGRRVGSSAYLGIVTITNALGETAQLRTMLPVRGIKTAE